ncbi:DedA family protein [Candidatus Falkowbacteria bacterium]|nr:MAG: DedA family protein [Candidatus Falkowbacteria bacterium]
MEIINLFIHFDTYLTQIINLFGHWVYVILFAIIFAETGLIITPFLPGDSLLFSVGTLSGAGLLNIWLVYFLMLIAAIIGDTVNYWVGHYLGPKVFSKENSRFFNKAYLEKTRDFYTKYGGKAVIIARFMPIVRTFAPFVAGIGKMHYQTFILYNVIGAFLWVTSFTFAGYFFGGLQFVKDNFEFVVLGIILISFIPGIYEFIKSRSLSKKNINIKKHNTSFQDIEKTFKKEHLNE